MTRATVPAPCRRSTADTEFCSYCFARAEEECPFADLPSGLLDTPAVGAAEGARDPRISATPTASKYGCSFAPIASPLPRGFPQADYPHGDIKGEQFARLASDAFDLVREDLDDDSQKMAQRAISDASIVIASMEFTEMPWVGISDDGIVTVQWQRDDKGIAFFFSGDGIFDFSVKASPTDHYSTDYVSQKVSNGVPGVFRSEVSKLS